jgi:hypothetical protein
LSIRDRLGALWLQWQGPPKRRSVAEVISILERELRDDASVDEWDDFISVPIEDPQLDAVRQRLHFPGGELPESRTMIKQCLRELRTL